MTIIEVSKPRVELTTKEQSYVYHLNANKNEIQDMYEDEAINTKTLIDRIKQIVINVNTKELSQKSKATLRFLASLESKKTKDDVVMLVWNSMMKGDGLGVI